jgi:hypothetical protein
MPQVPAAFSAVPSGTREQCPYLDAHLDRCYLRSITSGGIPRILQYCGGNYETCEVYQSMQDKETPPIEPTLSCGVSVAASSIRKHLGCISTSKNRG